MDLSKFCNFWDKIGIKNSSNKIYENFIMDEEDFYIEDGNVVFTESYLKKKGSCCENGCRHCPYGFEK